MFKCLTYRFAQSESRIVWKNEFIFMKTANIPVYGNIALSVYKIYTNVLLLHLFSTFTIKTSQALNREYTGKCTLTIICIYEWRLRGYLTKH